MQTILAKFKIRGPICYLSHSETMTLFLRSCVRAGIDLAYSHGFNPRPKLSLPLPRTVGIESSDDLLCLKIDDETDFDIKQFHESLNTQLPEGCQLTQTTSTPLSVKPQPASATYLLPLETQYVTEALKDAIARIIAAEELIVQRTKSERDPVKKVDVRKFINAIEIADSTVVVEYKISPAGTIRVDEILKLLEINRTMLTGPIRRTSIQWKTDTCPAVAESLNMKE